MDVAVLADSGPDVGLGHVVRSLALVEALREQGAHVTVFATPQASRVEHIVREFELVPLSIAAEALPPADVYVVDSYGLDRSTVEGLRTRARLIVQIADGTELETSADLVIDGQPGAETQRYRGPHLREMCVGPRYALVPAAFRLARETPRGDRLVVVLGGAPDPHTVRAVLEGARSSWQGWIDLVVGPYREVAAPDGLIRRHVGLTPAGVARLFMAAAAGVVGAGQTLLQAAAAAVPVVAVVVAPNQREQAAALERAGAILGAVDGGDVRRIGPLLQDTAVWGEVSRRASEVIDGLGAWRSADRIIAAFSER